MQKDIYIQIENYSTPTFSTSAADEIRPACAVKRIDIKIRVDVISTAI